MVKGRQIVLIGMIIVSISYSQFSPGKLAQPHAFLEGTHQCTQCHEVGGKEISNGCVECHTPIKVRIAEKVGYHKDKTNDCGSCHPDHHGREFQMIYWKEGESNFNHLEIGFDLDGKHKDLKCRDCHQQKFISDTNINDWIQSYPNEPIADRTFLGVSNTCNGCHKDIHNGEVTLDCASCHTTEDWKLAEKTYNHDLSKFPLIGMHEKVDCNKCHPTVNRNNKTILQLTGLEYSTCGSCHDDIHQGAYGSTCETCHTLTAGWKEDLIPFDHKKTKYPLEGKHQPVLCNKCHTKSLVGQLPKYDTCIGCHEDKHGGQFINETQNGDCEACHTVNGFIPTSYTFETHNQSRFVLDGSHFAIPCVNCHKPFKSGPLENLTQFKWEILECASCHDDIHRNQFIQREIPLNCEECHNTTSFYIPNFDHNQTRFPLDGEHINVACDKCHFIEKDRKGEFIRYYPIDFKCEDCHSIHELQQQK